MKRRAGSRKWGHFQLDQEGNWWFLTVGKGNKEREVSVSDAMLEALKRYRRARGLSPLPAPGEASPLIHKNRGGGGVGSTRQIRRIVQECFDRAAAGMRAEGFEEEADRLAEATVHWRRPRCTGCGIRTGISEDVKHRPREHVRDERHDRYYTGGHRFGHGASGARNCNRTSSAITDRYIELSNAPKDMPPPLLRRRHKRIQ